MSIPHVRGGKRQVLVGLVAAQFVFPTYVGVKGISHPPSSQMKRIPHVRGVKGTMIAIFMRHYRIPHVCGGKSRPLRQPGEHQPYSHVDGDKRESCRRRELPWESRRSRIRNTGCRMRRPVLSIGTQEAPACRPAIFSAQNWTSNVRDQIDPGFFVQIRQRTILFTGPSHVRKVQHKRMRQIM